MHTMTSEDIYEDWAQMLDHTGDYRVLRRLKQFEPPPSDGVAATWTGLVVDTETTGRDPAHDEIIEIAMLPFRYAADGRIVGVGEAWQGLRQPSLPIPPEATAVNGITDDMVAGQSIDPDEIAGFVASADLIVAHNAAFDRPFLERFCPAFEYKPFACSMTEIDWVGEGHEGLKLGYLAADHGFFHDRHRAVGDCHATLALLSKTLRKSGILAMAAMLEQARAPLWRIWAHGAPFEAKDLLKRRGYRWHDGSVGPEKAWYMDVTDDDRPAEMTYLEHEIFGRPVGLVQQRLTAMDRYSGRAFR